MLIAQGGANPIELSTNGVVRVFIKDDGNVGIGTTLPGAKLEVSGNILVTANSVSVTPTTATEYGYFVATNTGGSAYFGLERNVGAGLFAGSTAYQCVIGHTGNYPLGLYTNNLERLHITNAGNVGIGTVTPTSKLQVVGLPIYANNAAAILGGLTAGAFYRTGGDPDPVCVVH